MDVAAQFTHSRPSEKRSQKSETHVNSKSKSSKNYGMADIPPAQKHELACAFLSVRQHHTHSFHFGQFFSSLGAKAFASLQQYPFQIIKYIDVVSQRKSFFGITVCLLGESHCKQKYTCLHLQVVLL